MNNLAGCTIAVACIDYTAYAAYGYNPYLYQFNTGIWCVNLEMLLDEA
jgi:hypothetical protein